MKPGRLFRLLSFLDPLSLTKVSFFYMDYPIDSQFRRD